MLSASASALRFRSSVNSCRIQKQRLHYFMHPLRLDMAALLRCLAAMKLAACWVDPDGEVHNWGSAENPIDF